MERAGQSACRSRGVGRAPGWWRGSGPADECRAGRPWTRRAKARTPRRREHAADLAEMAERQVPGAWLESVLRSLGVPRITDQYVGASRHPALADSHDPSAGVHLYVRQALPRRSGHMRTAFGDAQGICLSRVRNVGRWPDLGRDLKRGRAGCQRAEQERFQKVLEMGFVSRRPCRGAWHCTRLLLLPASGYGNGLLRRGDRTSWASRTGRTPFMAPISPWGRPSLRGSQRRAQEGDVLVAGDGAEGALRWARCCSAGLRR